MLKNVSIESKGERPERMNREWFESSSDITTFNLYEQDWQTLIDEGLDRLFVDEAMFNGLKFEREGRECRG